MSSPTSSLALFVLALVCYVTAVAVSSDFRSFTTADITALSFGEEKPNVLIIYTGGTIGMVPTDHGYEPKAGYFEKQLRLNPAFSHEDTPNWDMIELDPLIDSSQIVPDNWVTISKVIESNYNKYDGFVVVHGTDTMAYTASALSFMLENLSKHVVVTGAQIPICEAYTDGINNLLGAIFFAGRFADIAEVTLFFDGFLYRGNRSTKLSAWSLHAFDSGSLEPLGQWGVTIKITNNAKRAANKASPLVVRSTMDATVVVIHLFPGITADFLKPLLNMKNLRGVIMDAFGTGNGPSGDVDLMKVLYQLNSRGVIIVDATQTHQGIVNLDEYAAGNGFKSAGVVSGLDLTIEAAYTKLVYLCSISEDTASIKKEITRNLVGELTPVAAEYR